MPTRYANAEWKGNLARGEGQVQFGSWKGRYSFASRFETGDGTNPEELIGAAHSGCFSMAFAHALSQAGHEPDSVRTNAAVKLEKTDAGFTITTIGLKTVAKVSGIGLDDFLKIANEAKSNCPVSRALTGVRIELEATLES